MIKRLGLALVLAMLATSSSVTAGPGGCDQYSIYTSFAFESVTVSTTSIGFTETVYAPDGGRAADLAIFTVQTDDVSARDDGLAPTASVGHVIPDAGNPSVVCGTSTIRKMRFIRVTNDATLRVSYYRGGN